jgi:hypothetical protein
MLTPPLIIVIEDEEPEPDETERAVCPRCQSTEWWRRTSGTFDRTDHIRVRGNGNIHAYTEDQDEEENDWEAWQCSRGHVGNETVQRRIEDLFVSYI